MSPGQCVIAPVKIGFPRVSGDEPHIHKCEGRKNQFSPRERG